MTQNQNNHRHIFLVDDDQEDREMFAEALSHVGGKNIRFTELSSVNKLMETLNDPDIAMPELIFLDINMPAATGMDCLKKLKAKNGKFNNLNIVIYSTYSHTDEINEAYKRGAKRYYVKPTVFDHLKDLISGALTGNFNTIERKDFFVKYSD